MRSQKNVIASLGLVVSFGLCLARAGETGSSGRPR